MEIGPVIVVSFQAQQIAYIADASGKVIEGDPVGCPSMSHPSSLISV